MKTGPKTYSLLRLALSLSACAGLLSCASGPETTPSPAPKPPAAQAAPAELRLERIKSLLARRDTQAALAELDALSATSPPETLRHEVTELRAQALDLAGDWLGSARQRAQLEQALAGGARAEQNRERLWRTLRRQRAESLQLARHSEADPLLAGYFELASLASTFAIDASRLQTEVRRWQEQHPEHPAALALPEELAPSTATAQSAYAPKQIALLLPLSGPLAASGTLIRDGFISAYYQQRGNPKAALRFYDSGTDPLASYQKAVNDGADFIVGPLEKEPVARLNAAGDLPVPTLSLNRAETPGPAKTNFYQLGLIPEDEALRLAERAAEDGKRRALCLMPRNLLGERLGQALRQQFEAAGGRIIETVSLDRAAVMDEALKQALGLRASQSRYQSVREIVGGPLGFEPRRRADIDSIFLSASPEQARQLKPLLNFYNAETVPVYASHRVYGSGADKDLDGIAFPDHPWLIGHSPELGALRNEVRPHFPSALDKRVARLFALGFDAYLLIPHLQQLRASPGARLAGLTGELSMTRNGWLVQRQPWARIRDGLAQPWPSRAP